jgi:DUF4097 and DUF4098 domain-containing protein YvlB
MRNRKAIVIGAVLAFLLVGAGLAVASEKYEEKFTKTESLALDGRVMLSNISGDVVVKTWDKAEVKIDAVKSSRASSAEAAKENAAKVTIEVDKSDNTVRIKVRYPEGKHKNLNVSVDFDLMIPNKASLDANTVSGDVEVEKIGGGLKAGTVSGDVTVMGAADGADAKTVSGDVTVTDVVGDAYLKTVSGDVTAKMIKGSVNAETISGEVGLNGISGARNITGKSLSGDVTFEGKLEKDGHYSFKSHSGDLHITIPADSAFDLSASTFSGDISTDFKVTVMGKISKKELNGTVNGGGADLNLSAFSGDVNLKKR